MAYLNISGWLDNAVAQQEIVSPAPPPPFVPRRIRQEALQSAPGVSSSPVRQNTRANPPQRPPTKRDLARGAARANDGSDSASTTSNVDNGQPIRMLEQANAGSDAHGGEEAESESPRQSDIGAQALAESLDSDGLSERLAPMSGDDGIFELLMPDGETMGVVVNAQPTQVNFLLSPSNNALGALLQKKKTELEGHLQRLIGRNVTLAVL